MLPRAHPSLPCPSSPLRPSSCSPWPEDADAQLALPEEADARLALPEAGVWRPNSGETTSAEPAAAYLDSSCMPPLESSVDSPCTPQPDCATRPALHLAAADGWQRTLRANALAQDGVSNSTPSGRINSTTTDVLQPAIQMAAAAAIPIATQFRLRCSNSPQPDELNASRLRSLSQPASPTAPPPNCPAAPPAGEMDVREQLLKFARERRSSCGEVTESEGLRRAPLSFGTLCPPTPSQRSSRSNSRTNSLQQSPIGSPASHGGSPHVAAELMQRQLRVAAQAPEPPRWRRRATASAGNNAPWESAGSAVGSAASEATAAAPAPTASCPSPMSASARRALIRMPGQQAETDASREERRDHSQPQEQNPLVGSVMYSVPARQL